jgi:Aminoglycoside-2''-adenylyltransferase
MVQGYDEGLEPEVLAFQRLYGPWRPASLAQAMELFEEFGRPWWIAGGWAIEAFTGVSRHHEDIDVAANAPGSPT